MHGECATGGQFPVQVVSLCVDLVLVAGVSMRAAPRVLELLGSLLGGSLAVDYGSVRTWLLRLGLFAFEGPKEQADDWALLIDHTVQLGACKCLVIVAVRLSRAPYPKRCLRYDDLEPIAVVPMEHSTGEAVHRELERVVDRIGVPRLIVSDHGSDVKKGIERFREQHPTTATTYDMAHKGACLLKHRLGADPRWSEFVAQLGRTKAHVQQTELAPLMGPALRPKARYMNLERVLRWARRMLDLLQRADCANVDPQRLLAKYGWLTEYAAAIGEWSQFQEVTRTATAYIRREGYHHGARVDLTERFACLDLGPPARKLADEIERFVAEQSAAARPGERFVGSTEALESCFGKLKELERQQAQSGFTGMVLSLGALLGKWTEETVRTALERTPWKAVTAWCAKHLGESLQAKRNKAFAAPQPETKPG